MRQPVSSSRRAFTLVEILVVVVILGIIGTVIGASLGSRDDLKVTAASRVLLADLQYAQNRAIVRRQPHYVIVGPGGSSLTFATREGSAWKKLVHPIEQKDFVMTFGPNGSGGGQEVLLATHNYNGRAVFGFDETGSPILCDGNGANRTSASITVSFTLAAGSFSQTVMIQPITGEMSVN